MNKKRMQINRNIQIKAYEIDSMGIVSNIHYVKWFEDMRHDFLDAYYPYDEMMQVGISPMLMKTEIEYKRALTIQNHPVGITWVTKMEKMRWEMCFEIYSEDTLCCKGVQKGCFWDLNKQRPTRVPQKLLKSFEEDTKE